MTFYHELKRRNVFRVGLAYGITAWLIAQIAGLAATSFFAPDWVMKMIITMLILGLPVAMVMAWAYELTPEGLRRESDVEAGQSTARVTASKLDRTITIVLVVAVAYFTYDKFVLDPKRDAAMLESIAQEIAQPDAENAPPEEEKSIAVLPFVNMSSDEEQEYFADGLSEELLNLLAKIPNLKVIGRTSSFAFKGKDDDLRDIGQTLGVRTILEGSVRKSGDRVRITAQLINALDGANLWSETYDRTMTEIFAVQDEVAAAIFDALQIHVGRVPTRGRPTGSPEAYALYLKARVAANASEWREARDKLLRAVELDPKFAEAYEMLSFVYWNLDFGISGAEELQRLVNEAAASAIALDPELVLAQTYYQATSPGPFIRLRTIEAFERAARERPDDPWILEGFTFLLTEFGYLQEALTHARRFLELDPLSELANSHLPAVLYAVGRTNEAVAALEFADPSNWEPGFFKWTIEGINLLENREEIAIAHFESWLKRHDYPDPNWFTELVTGGRDPATGQAFLDRRIPQIVTAMADVDEFDWQNGLTSLYLMFGHLDRHFELILATDPGDTAWHAAGGHFWRGSVFWRQGFTAHSKYLDLAEIMGIVEIWEQRGPPDFCEKVSGQWLCQ